MRIEEQLRHAYDRALATEPDEAGAYDRFLQRRARHDRVVAARTSLLLVVALVLTAAVPWALAHREAGPARPAGGGQLVNEPDQGFQLRLPAGWRVDHEDAIGLWLLPARTSNSPHLSPMIVLQTHLLDPGVHPDRPPSTPASKLRQELTSPSGDSLAYDSPSGRFVHGRRSDGRAYLRTNAKLSGGRWEQSYWLSWPYRCAPGTRCPAATRYRALHVGAGAPSRDWQAATQAALRQVVETVRPIGNAAGGAEAAATRRPCQVPSGPTSPIDMDMVVDTPSSGDAHQSGFELVFETRNFVPCRLRQQVTLELREGGHLAGVQGNRSTVRFDGILPEGTGDFAGFTASWRWRNWCGGRDVSVHWVGLRGYDLPASRFQRPPCLDPGKPSTLELVRHSR